MLRSGDGGMYDLDFYKSYTGDIDVLTINLSECFNSLEKYVSQTEYSFTGLYQSGKKDEEITIKILNENLPHLLGLSRQHHFNLPTYHASAIFQKIKGNEKNWTLEDLKKADEGWFNESREKLIGIFFLYQIMHTIETKNYSTTPFNGPKNDRLYKRIERDKVSYIFVKSIENASYSFEFTENTNEQKVYIPRSLKINDPIEKHLTPVSLENIKTERIKVPKRKKK